MNDAISRAGLPEAERARISKACEKVLTEHGQ